MSDKYVRPTDEEIAEEATRRGILQLIEGDPENGTFNLHKRVMELEAKNKIKSPESDLIERHADAITARADKAEADQKARDAQEKAREDVAAKKTKAKF